MRSFGRLFASILYLAVASSGANADELYKIDPARSTIEFKVGHFLGTAKGRFTNFSGTIVIDHEHPERSSVVATIQAASIDTGMAKRDEHLRSEEFFNVKKFPEITFKSRQVKRTGANVGEITGDLTMRGVTRALTLRAVLAGSPETVSENRTRWRVTTPPIKRSDFGLVFSKSAEAISMIRDKVNVDLTIEATTTR